MSSDGTSRLGDLHELPDCAPAGLKGLFDAAEGVIQEQVRLLGSGTPSKAPDLRVLLRGKGIADPEDESAMIDKYSDRKSQMLEATSSIHRKDAGIVVHTAGIGDAVTEAYGAVDTAVGELNTKIDASFKSVRTVKDEDGTSHQELPREIIDGLFKGVWECVGTTYDKVHGVSDKAAAAALKIKGDAPPSSTGNPVPAVAPSSGPSAGATPSAYNGSTPWSGQSGSMGTAIIPTTEKPTAMAMMKYLIDTYHFTPAQAAGIVANAKFESGFDVSATGDNGSAKGLFQWRFDRLSGLQAFAKRPGENIGDWHTHLDYMVQELRGGNYQQANNAVTANPNDARTVAESFDRYYEKSAGLSTNDRRDYAAGLLAEYNKSALAV
ncbi:phage tail tip lysozyme [Nocardia aobensis]|uniref:phage tail tip lysozyme n=1 Tax=Nocardia aobensis TaxID=257277 RepID=UPI0002FC4884|nr:phage tail tip lysozyme [Nocardia aobensis]